MTDPFENQTQNMNLNKGRQSTRMIWPGHLRMPRFSERLDPGSDIDGLINSIREYGQKVPILVRRLPDGELEIVYGVRRVLACIALGYEVRAMVTEMSDKEALITRGIENNERVTSRRSESHPNENFVDEFSKARSTVPPDLDIETYPTEEMIYAPPQLRRRKEESPA